MLSWVLSHLLLLQLYKEAACKEATLGLLLFKVYAFVTWESRAAISMFRNDNLKHKISQFQHLKIAILIFLKGIWIDLEFHKLQCE